MPVLRYFLGVGAVLLALIFLAGVMFPKPEATAEHRDIDHSVIRIAAAPKISAAAVTIDTRVAMPAPDRVVVPENLPAPVAAVDRPAPTDARAELAAPAKPALAAQAAPKRRHVAARPPAREPPPQHWAFQPGFFGFRW